jgi:hypothetical protein
MRNIVLLAVTFIAATLVLTALIVVGWIAWDNLPRIMGTGKYAVKMTF